MDRTEFIKIMKKKHVPNFYYNIEGTGRDDERFYLNKDEHGWNVYYAERGCKTTKIEFIQLISCKCILMLHFHY